MRILLIISIVAVAFAVPAAQAAKGGAISTTIAISGNPAQPIPAGTQISFDVARSIATSDVLWVYNYCYDTGGKLLSTEAYPVLWPSWDSLTGSTDPYKFTLTGVRCTALVTERPWNAQPTKGDSTISYTVK